MSRYPQLQIVFENDIKDLLGVRRQKPNKGNYGFILSDLLKSILALGIKDRFYVDHEEMISVKDFRLRLASILCEIFKTKVCLILKDVLKDPTLECTVEEDFNRTLAWSTILADSVDQSEDSEPPHRTILFDTRQSREDGEIEVE